MHPGLRQFDTLCAIFSTPGVANVFSVRKSEGCYCTEDTMPSYEIRYLNSEGELTLIHKAHHADDEAVDLAALRMLMGSGLADYEIWREDDGSDQTPGT